MIYCAVQGKLPGRAERALSRYSASAAVEVVTEQRAAERRVGQNRRTGLPPISPVPEEQRRVRPADGRRVAERRLTVVPVAPPEPLPRKLQPYAGSLQFGEKIPLTRDHAEDITTARLISRIQAGETDLFEHVYECYFPRVFTFLGLVLEQEADAEHVTQETFLDLYDLVARYAAGPLGFREQLANLMRGHAADHLTASHGSSAYDSAGENGLRGDSTFAQELPDWVTDQDLVLLIGRLPLAQRQVLLLRYLMRLSEYQVARILDCSVDSLVDLQENAFTFLRARLALIGKEFSAPSLRLSMVSGRRPARVIQSRRLALSAG